MTSVQFQSDVQSFFQQTDSRVSMSYKFFSSDPNRRLLFPTNQITSSDQFIAFSTVVGDYCNNMSPAWAARTDFIVEPMQNLPGYAALVEGSGSTNHFETDYNRFLDAYGALKQWDQQLTAWTIDNRLMSWMNTNGQRLVFTMRKEVADFVKTLEELAKNHFAAGSPLEVPDEIFNYFVNFDRIPIPALGVLYSMPPQDPWWVCQGGSAVVGYLICGKSEFTVEHPFLSVDILRDNADTGYRPPLVTMQVFYDNYANRFGWGGCNDDTFVCARAASGFYNPLWPILLAMTNDSRILVFYARMGGAATGPSLPGSTDLSRYSMAVKDNAGEIVESVNLTTASTPTSATLLAASPQTELSVVAVGRPSLTALDSSSAWEYAITNNGPGTAYGVRFSMPMPDGMQALSVSGSQGQGTITNNTVKFDVGPLASGSVARVHIAFVPLRTGQVGGGTPATVAPGEGLNDSQPANDAETPPVITVTSPTLGLTKGPGYVELSWISETGLILPQDAPTLAGPVPWTPMTNGIVSDGGRKTLRVPVTTSSQFFRLGAQTQ